MNKNAPKGKSTFLYPLRMVAAFYILYQAYLLLKELQAGRADVVIVIIAVTVFTIFSGVIIVTSALAMLKEWKLSKESVELNENELVEDVDHHDIYEPDNLEPDKNDSDTNK